SQSGSTRVTPLVLALVASATIAGLIAIGSLTGVLPGKGLAVRSEEALPRVEPRLAKPAPCAACGTIEGIRTVEVVEEPGAVRGAAEIKSDRDAPAASPSTAMSVLDTLSSAMGGSEAEKSV